MNVIPLHQHRKAIPRPNGGAADGTEGRNEPASLGAKQTGGQTLDNGGGQGSGTLDSSLPATTTHAIVIEHRGAIS
jgi:hypothetical protein